MSDEKETDVKSSHNDNSKWTGFVLLIIGGFLLSQRLGFPLPARLFNWQTFLIALGFFVGIRHRFHGPGWLILILIGGFFYAADYYPGIAIHEYIWPIILIGAGLIFIIRPRQNNRNKYFNNWDKWKEKKQQWEQYKDTYSSGEDYIDVTSIFGGTTKNILSKDFKGGDVVSLFGGSEINLGQADITGRVVLDLTQIFGGTKLIVPPHWNVIRAGSVSIFGGIDDKRPLDASVIDPNKILVLRGTSIFGGIEIRSY
jgi:hypothetical protein